MNHNADSKEITPIVPRTEIDAVTERHGDGGFFGDNDFTVQEVRAISAYLRGGSAGARALAADLDALADRYERAGVMTLAEQIRAHVDGGAQLFESDRAVLAVVDKCEQMRAESTKSGGWAFADTLESVIADALDIQH